jgi:hypothetical protein
LFQLAVTRARGNAWARRISKTGTIRTNPRFVVTTHRDSISTLETPRQHGVAINLSLKSGTGKPFALVFRMAATLAACKGETP